MLGVMVVFYCQFTHIRSSLQFFIMDLLLVYLKLIMLSCFIRFVSDKYMVKEWKVVISDLLTIKTTGGNYGC